MTTENTPAPAPETPPAAPTPAPAPAAPLAITAAPAPGEPPALAPAPAPAPTPAAPGVVIYNETGDVGLDMTLKFVGEQGYGPDHPAMQAAINGDFSLLEAELAAKGVKGYEAYIKLGQKAYTDVSTKTAERQAKDKAAVEGVVGGAEQWTAIQGWAEANAEPAEKAAFKGMLGRGGLEAQAAASYLAQLYGKANNVNTEGAGPKVVATKTAPGGTEGMTRQEYTAAVMAARNTFKGGDFENSSEYKQLQQRRQAGMNAGK